MIRTLRALALIAAALWAMPASAAMAPEATLAAARDAYNDGRYDEAASLFLQSVQAQPTEAGLYRDLARARSWTKDTAGAVVAFRLYLSMAPGAEDRAKVEAELRLVQRKANEDPPPGPPVIAAATLKSARAHAEAKETPEAIAMLEHAIAQGYIGAELSPARAEIIAALTRDSVAAVESWGRPEQTCDPARLTALASAARLALDKPTTGLDTPTVRQIAAVTQGLVAVREGRDAAAVNLLAEHAASSPHARFALAVALYRLGRADEAAQSLSVLDAADARVAALRALAERAAGRPMTEHAARALGIEPPATP